MGIFIIYRRIFSQIFFCFQNVEKFSYFSKNIINIEDIRYSCFYIKTVTKNKKLQWNKFRIHSSAIWRHHIFKLANNLYCSWLVNDSVSLYQLVRMDHNTKNVRIETPADINEEVKNILMATRKKQSQQQQQQSDRPRTPRKLRISTNTSIGNKEPHNPIAGSKFLVSQSYNIADLSNVTTSERPRTPAYPEVQLLNDQRNPETYTKPIGFRPSWKCEA